MSAEVRLELMLLSGERKSLTLPSHTGSMGTALDRLHEWIETDDGSWIQKRFVVEVRLLARRATSARLDPSTSEHAALEHAVDAMLGEHRGDQARTNG